MKKKLILLALSAVALVLAFRYIPSHCDCGPKEEVSLGRAVLSVDVANTPAAREQGLSGRKSLGEDEGMLFVFGEPFVASFWMKDMLFPIDIIWIGEDMEVVGLERAVSPATYPETFSPPSPVKYVLEVPAGFSDAEKINVGDVLSIGQ